MIKRAIKDAAIYSVSTGFLRVLLFIQVPLFSRSLTSNDFGVLELITALITFINLVIPLEISQGLAIRFSSEPDHTNRVKFASSALWFTLAAYVVFFMVAWPFSNYIASQLFGQTGESSLGSLFLLCTVVNGIFLLLLSQLRWMLLPVKYLLTAAISGLSNIALATVLVYSFHAGLQGILEAQIVAGLVGSLCAFYFGRQLYGWNFDRTKWLAMLEFSLPLVPASLSVALVLYADRFILEWLVGLGGVGAYGVAYRIAGIAGVFVAGISAGLTPLIYNFHREMAMPQRVVDFLRYYTLCASCFVFFLILFSREILWALRADEYAHIIPVIPVIALGLFSSNLYIFVPGLTIARRSKIMSGVGLAAALLNVLLNWFLISAFGIAGAAWSLYFCGLFTFAAWWKLGQRDYPIVGGLRQLGISLGLITAACGANLSPLGAIRVDLMPRLAIYVAGVVGFAAISLSRAELKSLWAWKMPART